MELTQHPLSAAAPGDYGGSMKTLDINAIRIDGGTQSRVEINNEIVADYAECIRSGIEFPPVVAFHDGADYWLADGFHRLHAYKRAEKASITVEVRSGSLEDAQLFAAGANSTHGLYRSNADKRKAVTMTLAIPRCADWSDRKIAEHCKVSVPLVGAVRRPAVAQRQRENRSASAKRVLDKRKRITPAQIGREADAPALASASARATGKPQRTLEPERPTDVPELTDADRLAEAEHTNAELAEENQQLRDRLAVAAMDASEEEKLRAEKTIRELRAHVVGLQAELDAVKVTRDTYMREANEAKKDAIRWRNKAEKAERASA